MYIHNVTTKSRRYPLIAMSSLSLSHTPHTHTHTHINLVDIPQAAEPKEEEKKEEGKEEA